MLSTREATTEDAAEVAGIHVRAWQVAYRGLVPDSVLDGLRVADRAARYDFGDTRPGRPVTVVAVVAGVIRGFVTLGPARDELAATGEVYALYVDPPAWGHGVGRALVAQARDRLCEQGFVEAVLWVLADNERARRFYRTDGWRPDGQRRDDHIPAAAVTTVRYRRGLP